MSEKAEFHRCLGRLVRGADHPDPVVRSAARTALETILREAERILAQVKAEQFMLEGWNHADKPTDH
jgi:hypothetical protein